MQRQTTTEIQPALGSEDVESAPDAQEMENPGRYDIHDTANIASDASSSHELVSALLYLPSFTAHLAHPSYWY